MSNKSEQHVFGIWTVLLLNERQAVTHAENIGAEAVCVCSDICAEQEPESLQDRFRV